MKRGDEIQCVAVGKARLISTDELLRSSSLQAFDPHQIWPYKILQGEESARGKQ